MEFLQYHPPPPSLPPSASDGLQPTASTAAPQLRRSCEACRASKSRCYASTEDPQQCQKCIIHGKECVFMETKSRSKKTSKPFPARVQKVEHRLHEIDAILAMLSRGQRPGTSPVTSKPSHGQWGMTRPWTGLGPAALQPNEMSFPSTSSPQGHSLPGYVGINDAIGRGTMSFDQAQQCLELFQRRASGFPFIVIDPQTTLDILRRDNPFLLLSILAMATETDLRLQDDLEAELRETLSRRVIMNGETSLDLLQGLLLYLAWYQFYLQPGRQQVHRLSQISVSMAVDLGITKPEKKNKCAHPYVDEGNFLSHRDMPLRGGSTSKSLVIKRTFLGCYYQSSCLSTALRRPLGMRYTDYMAQCAHELASAREHDTDVLIPHFIRIQRLSDDVNLTFDYDENLQLPELDAIRIESHLNSFNRHISEVEQKVPPDLWNNATLAMSVKHLRIYINEIALHSTPSTFDTLSGGISCLSWRFSASRTETLTLGVEAARMYLDHYFSLPPNSLSSFSFLEHLKNFYALLTILIFAAGVDSPTTKKLQSSANVEFYVTGVMDRATQLVSLGKDEEQVDFFRQLTKMLKITHSWFLDHSKQSDMIHQGIADSDVSLAGSTETVSEFPVIENWTGDTMPDDWQFALDSQFDANAFIYDSMT